MASQKSLVCLLFLALTVASSASEEAKALLIWKASLSRAHTLHSWPMPPTANASSFAPVQKPCNWTGIKCNDAGNVVEINLSNSSLQGTLHTLNFSSFPDLVRLDVSLNSFHGTIPPTLGNLSHLTDLELYANQLYGPVPPELGRLGHLTVLRLGVNRLTGFIPPTLGNLSHLGELTLYNNQLSGLVPPELGSLANLTYLDLSNNSLFGSIPPTLGNLSHLTDLELCANQLCGPIPREIGQLSKLEFLDLGYNQLEGQMPRSLANCKELRVLNLGNNQMKDGFSPQLANLSNLQVLVLKSNKFSGCIGQPLASQEFFPMLQIIDLSSNNFSGSLPSNLFSAWKVMKDGESASEFRAANHSIDGLYYKETMFLSIKGREIELVKIFFALTLVDLSHNQFDGDIPSSIGELQALHVLNMSHNLFKGEIPASLGNVGNLESLDLSHNSLSGKIPWQLTNLSFLEVLNLSQNQLIGSIPRGRQFDTFENDSFLGNPELCGHPLSRKCEEDAASMPPGQPDTESALDFMWIGFGVGHAVGFGILFWTLALWREGRQTFFMFVDRVLSSILFFVKCSDMWPCL